MRQSSLEYPILGILLIKNQHGYDLHQHISENLNMLWHASQSQVYATLERLEAKGLIVGDLQAQEKRPARHVFSLTPAGKAMVEQWLYQPTPCSVQAVRMELPTRLFILNQINPAQIPAVVEAQKSEIHSGYLSISRSLSNLPSEQIYNRMALQIRLQQIEALLTWMEESLPKLLFKGKEQ
jgi:PadR family transcriptional regulator AphA